MLVLSEFIRAFGPVRPPPFLTWLGEVLFGVFFVAGLVLGVVRTILVVGLSF